MQWYNYDVADVERLIKTNFKQGLNEKEANKRLEASGYNQLDEGKPKSAFTIFFAQFKDFMVLILLVATVISLLLGEYLDASAIIVIVFLNACLGFIQERKAEKSLQALKRLSAPQVQVLRNEKWQRIPSRNIVVGDVIQLKSGDRVGADVRLFEANGLRLEESALTGESIPVEKTIHHLRGNDLPIGDQENMAFMGTLVTAGSGRGIVVSTGMKTAMGHIAHLLKHSVDLVTPLQKKLGELGRILMISALFLTFLVVFIGVWQGNNLYSMILAGVSLAVAAIPEGLPAVVTVSLSLGVQRMIKKKVIVRKLQSIETLGSATVICSDKTGTLTQNKMTVTSIVTLEKEWTVTGSGYLPRGEFLSREGAVNPGREKELMQLLTFSVLCNDAALIEEKNDVRIDGDPTEGALLVAAKKAHVTKESLLRQFECTQQFSFDSDRKMMSVIVSDANGKQYVITKGAPDVLLERCTSVLWKEKKERLTAKKRQEIERSMDQLASQALRTIAIAFRPLHSVERINRESEAEKELIFVGLFGMIDPPRQEAKRAITTCKKAGIKTVMITGDHVKTASAIASELNILPHGGKVIDGTRLKTMTIEDLEAVVDDVYVFARVSPEDKLKIVQAFQRRGHIVAMTGDGVNDAPAIKNANIGISMGITGTDVSKEASALIILDDHFETIVEAIKEGRNIYENIRKFIRYMMASNVGEILVMLFAMILGLPLPLIPIQILWVNLITDGLPAMALGVDPPEKDMMKRPPRGQTEGVFSRGLGMKILTRGIAIGGVSLVAFIVSYQNHPDHLQYAQTMAFSTLVCTQLIHVFDCRSEYSVFHRNPFSNVPLLLAVLSSFLLLFVVIYIDGLQMIFHTVYLSVRDWLLILLLSSIPTFVLAGFHVFRKQPTTSHEKLV